ncbi:serine proteinase inhibitor IA-1 [Lactarius vividus]|nr:serine proteinase inhibitor IA-1 [Lactarius vividus]
MSATGKYIVVFKNTASDEAINEQAEKVGLNGGKVDKKFSSSLLKGFSAEIPATYLLTLQSSLTTGESQIDYIEPDSVVTTQTTT